MEMLIILVLAAGAMFLLTSRQRKQQRAAQDLLANIQPGQEVMTGSGMFGTVVDIDSEADVVTIETTPGVQTRWLRAAIRKVVEPPVPDDATDELGAASIASGSPEDVDDQVEDIVVPDDLSGLSDQGADLDKDSTPRREDDDDTK